MKIGEAGSSASKALRIALLGLFEAQRATAVETVYGTWASTIADPIWPGSPLSSNRATEAATPDAALENAVSLLRYVGYAWDGERFTEAPDGGTLCFTMQLAEGSEDSVAYIMAQAVQAQLEDIGITLTIKFVDPLI